MHLSARPWPPIACVVAGLLLLPPTSPGQADKSGITGVVIQTGHAGPTRAGDPTRYYKGPLEVMRSTDKSLAANADSDENGRFTVLLPQGKYFITQSNRRYSRIHSQDITVEEGKLTEVKIYADNGMR